MDVYNKFFIILNNVCYISLLVSIVLGIKRSKDEQLCNAVYTQCKCNAKPLEH